MLTSEQGSNVGGNVHCIAMLSSRGRRVDFLKVLLLMAGSFSLRHLDTDPAINGPAVLAALLFH